MEGEQGPESGQDQPPSPKKEEPAAAVTQRQSWRSRLAKIPLPARVAAALGVTLGAAGTAVGVGIHAATEGDSHPNEPAATTHIDKPPSATDQVVEIIPTPKEASPTPQATPAPAAETPAPAPTQEPTPQATETVSKYTWNFDHDPALSETSYFGRTIEQDMQTIQQFAEKIPRLSNLKVILVEGSGSSIDFSTNPPEMRIGRGAFQIEKKIAFEFANYLNIQANPYIRENFTPQEIKQLEDTQNEILQDVQNFPSIRKLFDKDKPELTKYADAIWIAQSPFEYTGQDGVVHRFPLEKPIFLDRLKSPLLDQFVTELENDPNSIPASDFVDLMNKQSQRFQLLENENQFYRVAFQILRENQDVLGNITWAAGQPVMLNEIELHRQMQKLVPLYAGMALTQGFLENDPRVMQLPMDVGSVRQQTNILLSACRNELFGEIYSGFLLGETRVGKIFGYHLLVSSK